MNAAPEDPVLSGTKASLLDAAEALFAEHGVAGASLRAITSRAGVNLAAANYHFGSKDALLRAVIARRMRPVNRVRIARLDALEAEATAHCALEDLVDAFLAPVLVAGRALPGNGRDFVQLIGRVLSGHEEMLRGILQEELGEVIARFVPAFQRALPELGESELLWRIHFMLGALAHVMGARNMITLVRGDPAPADDLDRVLAALARFVIAGLRAAPGFSDAASRAKVPTEPNKEMP